MDPKVTIQSLADLVLDDGNANLGTARGRKMLEESIRSLGAGRSILVDRKGRVIAGNKTVETARKLGMSKIAVIESNGETLVVVRRADLDLKRDKKAKRLAIADNRVAEIDLAWDPNSLNGYGLELAEFWNDKELKNFGLADQIPSLQAPEPRIDCAAELLKKWKTSLGQIWKIGEHRLACGDSTNHQDVERLLDGAIPQLMVTDQPYGVSYDPTWRAEAGVNKSEKKMGLVTNDDRADWTAAWQLFPGDVAYVWHGGVHADVVKASLETVGFDIRAQIIWAKDRFALGRGDYHWQHEPCWYAVRAGSSSRRTDDRSQATLWEIAAREDAGHGHGTQKPVECMGRPIRNHMFDSVYDPFAGTGTTIAAAEQLGRRSLTMEIEPKYVAVTLERLSEMGLKPKVLK